MSKKSHWEEGLEIPKAPKGATHATIKCGKKKATVVVKDFSSFRGVEGVVSWGQQKRSRKTIEPIGEEFFWDGFKVG